MMLSLFFLDEKRELRGEVLVAVKEEVRDILETAKGFPPPPPKNKMIFNPVAKAQIISVLNTHDDPQKKVLFDSFLGCVDIKKIIRQCEGTSKIWCNNITKLNKKKSKITQYHHATDGLVLKSLNQQNNICTQLKGFVHETKSLDKQIKNIDKRFVKLKNKISGIDN